jgi:hypothetical protein
MTFHTDVHGGSLLDLATLNPLLSVVIARVGDDGTE